MQQQKSPIKLSGFFVSKTLLRCIARGFTEYQIIMLYYQNPYLIDLGRVQNNYLKILLVIG